MSVDVKVYCEDIAGTLASYDTVRLYRGSDPATRPFAGLPVASASLVASQTDYVLTDTNGTADNWYRFSYYSSVTTLESEQSDAIKPGGVTLRYLLGELVREGGIGFDGTPDASSGLSLLVDPKLRDMGVDAGYMGGAFIWRPDAANAGDAVRRIGVQGFDPTTGGFTPTRAWAGVPSSSERYYVSNVYPLVDWAGFPYSWARAVRSATESLFFADRLSIGKGTATGKHRFDLGTHLAYAREDNIRRVLVQRINSNGEPEEWELGTNGTDWQPVQDNDGMAIDTIGYLLSTNETLVVEVNRAYDAMYAPGDMLTGPLSLAVLASLGEGYQRANAFYDGQYGKEAAYWTSKFAGLYTTRWRPRNVIRGL